MYRLLKPFATITFFLLIVQSANAQLKKGVVSIPFKFNSYAIDSNYLPLLDSLADALKQHPHFHIKMYGFTDTTGTEDYNFKLANKRLNSVYNYLAAKVQLTDKNTYVDSQDESGEKYDLHFPEAHVQQRYVDIKVYFGK